MKIFSQLGLGLSLTGLAGVIAAGFLSSFSHLGIEKSIMEGTVLLLAACSLPGLIISLISHLSERNRMTLLGTLVGLASLSFLPTLMLAWLR